MSLTIYRSVHHVHLHDQAEEEGAWKEPEDAVSLSATHALLSSDSAPIIHQNISH